MSKFSRDLAIALIGGAFAILAALIGNTNFSNESVTPTRYGQSSINNVVNNSAVVHGSGTAISGNNIAIANTTSNSGEDSVRAQEIIDRINEENHERQMRQQQALDAHLKRQAEQIDRQNKLNQENLDRQMKDLNTRLSTMFDPSNER